MSIEKSWIFHTLLNKFILFSRPQSWRPIRSASWRRRGLWWTLFQKKAKISLYVKWWKKVYTPHIWGYTPKRPFSHTTTCSWDWTIYGLWGRLRPASTSYDYGEFSLFYVKVLSRKKIAKKSSFTEFLWKYRFFLRQFLFLLNNTFCISFGIGPKMVSAFIINKIFHCFADLFLTSYHTQCGKSGNLLIWKLFREIVLISRNFCKKILVSKFP